MSCVNVTHISYCMLWHGIVLCCVVVVLCFVSYLYNGQSKTRVLVGLGEIVIKVQTRE